MQPDVYAVGIRIDMWNGASRPASTRVTIANCRIHNFSFNGIWARQGTSQLHFRGNESYANQGNGIELEGQDASVIDNELHDNQGQGIEVYSPAQRVRVTSNKMDGNKGTGIKLINDPSFGVLSSVNVLGNEVAHNGLAGILYWSALGAASAPSGLITISANTVNENEYWGITIAQAGIGIAVIGNVVSSNMLSGINISGSTDVVVSDNVLASLPGTNSSVYGIIVTNESQRVLLRHNLVQTGSQTPLVGKASVPRRCTPTATRGGRR